MKYEYSFGGVSADSVRETVTKLESYRAKLADIVSRHDYGAEEASLVAPFDEDHVVRATETAHALGAVSHVVLVGIGGSSMGTACVYEAVRTEAAPTLHIVDVLDAEKIARVVEVLKKVLLSDFAIVVISKSGSTTETLANAGVLLSELSKSFPYGLNSRVVCVGNEQTPLATYAEKSGMRYVSIPEKIGGRFSVFSAVGLVPLLLLRFDVSALLKGARTAIVRGTQEAGSALDAGAVLAEQIQKDARIYALFAENDRLLGFVNWYQQLIAESLGKVTSEGKKIGIAPVCMSPRELHSTAQLYLSGFPGVFTHFIGAHAKPVEYRVAEDGLGELVSFKGERSYAQLPTAVMGGVHAAYVREGLPHVRLEIGDCIAENIGDAMAEKMLEIMYTAHILGIDAFNQPHVELYKKETRRILDEETN